LFVYFVDVESDYKWPLRLCKRCTHCITFIEQLQHVIFCSFLKLKSSDCAKIVEFTLSMISLTNIYSLKNMYTMLKHVSAHAVIKEIPCRLLWHSKIKRLTNLPENVFLWWSNIRELLKLCKRNAYMSLISFMRLWNFFE
jgi:hypothetical protein